MSPTTPKKVLIQDQQPLPSVPRPLIDGITDYLTSRYGMRRPPIASARMLALMVVLHQQDRYFPTRQPASEFVGCSIWGIDTAIAVALSRGLITLHMHTPDAGESVKQRASVFRLRYYVPCPELLEVARDVARGVRFRGRHAA